MIITSKVKVNMTVTVKVRVKVNVKVRVNITMRLDIKVDSQCHQKGCNDVSESHNTIESNNKYINLNHSS